MLSNVTSCTVQGIDGFTASVEVDISFGLPVFTIVGLPEISVKESRERVKSAVNNSGYTFPMDRVVVNLSPADIKKDGTGFDLPIAVAILSATGVIPQDSVSSYMICGELSLDGNVKAVKAALPFALSAKENGLKGILIPFENASEVSMIEGIEILAVSNLSEVVDFLAGHRELAPFEKTSPVSEKSSDVYGVDFADVKGQAHAKRALEIAAAGFHNVLMSGPPGAGKSMLARRVPTILPLLTQKEAVEVARIHSVAPEGFSSGSHVFARPFRSPHHTISDAGLVGGGSKPAPGEISLAHNGVLFLDELPEFKRNVLEVLRQPMEDGSVVIARAGMKVTYPSRFMLLAAMNPCPCGFFSDPSGKCSCPKPQIDRYRSKISGPLLDRIDLQLEVPRLEYKALADESSGESSKQIRERVWHAVRIQQERFADTQILNNASMNPRHIKDFCSLDAAGEKIFEKAADTLHLSARACHSILRVARTIADLEPSEQISVGHLAEAIGYRSFDRGN